ncbi:MAG: hypothetical protein C0438_03445 [Pseudomonas sp.]|nr:hypothetical protein [Pseudomonas sp.]
MSREDSQFKLRMPSDLRESIEEASREAKRSLNAEIVARLEMSVVKESTGENLIPAKKAQQLATMARQSIPATIKKRILEAINQAIAMGHATAAVDFKDMELDALPREDVNQILDVFTEWLHEAGYAVEWDGPDSLWVQFDDL